MIWTRALAASDLPHFRVHPNQKKYEYLIGPGLLQIGSVLVLDDDRPLVIIGGVEADNLIVVGALFAETARKRDMVRLVPYFAAQLRRWRAKGSTVIIDIARDFPEAWHYAARLGFVPGDGPSLGAGFQRMLYDPPSPSLR